MKLRLMLYGSGDTPTERVIDIVSLRVDTKHNVTYKRDEDAPEVFVDSDDLHSLEVSA